MKLYNPHKWVEEFLAKREVSNLKLNKKPESRLWFIALNILSNRAIEVYQQILQDLHPFLLLCLLKQQTK